MEKQRKTFLSYSRVNKDFAIRLAKELKAEGFDVWLDQLDIPAGARWDREVERALRESEIFMIILTAASVDSENVLDEIGYAIDNTKRFLPVLLEKCEVPLRLRRFQYVDFTNKTFDDGVESAKDLLRTLVAQPTIPRIQLSQEQQNQLAQTEAERVAGQKVEEELGAKAKAETEREAKDKADRLAAQKAEEARLAKQKAEDELAAKAKTEKEGQAKQAADRLAAQKAEEERIAQAKVDAERKAEEDREAKFEANRVAAQKAEEERIAKTSVPSIAGSSPAQAKKPASRGAIIGIVFVIGICVLAVGAYGIIQLMGTAASATQEPVYEAPAATEEAFTEAPAATEEVFTEAPAATEEPVSDNNLIFSDDFSNPESGWPVDEYGYYGENGSYYLYAEEGTTRMSSPNVVFSDLGPDLAVQVAITYMPDGIGGVYCRENHGAFYLFQIDFRGPTALIWYYDGSNWENLAEESVTLSDSYNYIIGACQGDSLNLYWNGEYVVGVTDNRLPDAGEVGIYMESKEPSGTTTEFDDFYVVYP